MWLVLGGDRFGYGFNTVDPKLKTRISAQEQLQHFVVPKDFEIELVAADPVVINPITMVLDDKGRIIVSESQGSAAALDDTIATVARFSDSIDVIGIPRLADSATGRESQ